MLAHRGEGLKLSENVFARKNERASNATNVDNDMLIMPMIKVMMVIVMIMI